MSPTPCPWDSLTPGTVHFCEARLCAWVAEPSNAWSSVAYLLVGAYLALHAARSRDARLWAVVAAEVLIGLGSFAFGCGSPTPHVSPYFTTRSRGLAGHSGAGTCLLA
jgi:hypothetical protein